MERGRRRRPIEGLVLSSLWECEDTADWVGGYSEDGKGVRHIEQQRRIRGN
jgi:hypothetical protein